MSFSYGNILLQILDVNLKYGDNTVLRNINADIREIKRDSGRGQIVGILGPSGCGKTSLLRIIAGLDRPTTGVVTVEGGLRANPGMVGVVSQSYTLFPNRSVHGNLMLAARRKYLKAAKDQVDLLLNRFDLSQKSYHYPSQLSGGQRQRVAILQQVLGGQRFLLMDEPFSGLDVIAEDKVCKLIADVASLDSKNTIVIVSHDTTAIASICDHIWVLGRQPSSPGYTIVKQYSLPEMDLCWHEDIQSRPDFVEFVRGLKMEFLTL
jgi:ABC-type nitrate/sulfonate/bicarbonate transport system ATPase subunit